MSSAKHIVYKIQLKGIPKERKPKTANFKCCRFGFIEPVHER